MTSAFQVAIAFGGECEQLLVHLRDLIIIQSRDRQPQDFIGEESMIVGRLVSLWPLQLPPEIRADSRARPEWH